MRKFKFALLFLFTTSYLLLASPIYADNPCEKATDGGFYIASCFGFGNITSLGQLVSPMVPVAFSIAAIAVIIYFLIGAFKYLISGGNKESAAEARNMITHAIVGFVILIFVFFIIPFLLSSLFNISNFQLFKSPFSTRTI